jgi:hypothetical protein
MLDVDLMSRFAGEGATRPVMTKRLNQFGRMHDSMW